MAEYCMCGSLKVEGACTNHPKNCPEGKNKRRPIEAQLGRYLQHKKTGVLMDQDTGTLITPRRRTNGKKESIG